jgi:hypothetical protein
MSFKHGVSLQEDNIFGISLMKILNRMGLRLSPCRTPMLEGKDSVRPLFVLILIDDSV